MADLPIWVKEVNRHEVTHQLERPFMAGFLVRLNESFFGSDFAFELRYDSSIIVGLLPFQREVVRLAFTIPFFLVAELYWVRSSRNRRLARLGWLSCGKVDDAHLARTGFSHVFVLALKLVELSLAEARLITKSTLRGTFMR